MEDLNLIVSDWTNKRTSSLENNLSILNNLNFLDLQKAKELIKPIVRKRFIQRMKASNSESVVNWFEYRAQKTLQMIESIFSCNTSDSDAYIKDVDLIKSILTFEISIEKSGSRKNREIFNIEHFGKIYNFAPESYEKQSIQTANEIQSALDIFEKLTAKIAA